MSQDPHRVGRFLPLNGRKCLRQPLLRRAAEQQPRHRLAVKGGDKPFVHFMADHLAIAQAVLDERDFVAG